MYTVLKIPIDEIEVLEDCPAIPNLASVVDLRGELAFVVPDEETEPARPELCAGGQNINFHDIHIYVVPSAELDEDTSAHFRLLGDEGVEFAKLYVDPLDHDKFAVLCDSWHFKIWHDDRSLADQYNDQGYVSDDDIDSALSGKHLEDVELLVDELVKDCQTSGLVDLASWLDDDSRQYYRKHDAQGHLSDELLLLNLERGLRDRIAQGDLDGFFDAAKHEYRDRSLIVHEQRVVQYNVQLDFNQLVQQLGNKGIILTSVQCNQCGAPCAIPKDKSESFRCGSCGNIIQVTDVFEKFKSILE